MTAYSAKINHSEDTIRRMAKVQCRTFGVGAMTASFLIALFLIGIGLFGKPLPDAAQVICIAFGCFALVSMDQPAKVLAQQVIVSLNGNFPKVSYQFHEKDISLTGTDTAARVSYGEIIRLVEDKEYLYLFVTDKSAYMIDRAEVIPGDSLELKGFLAAKVGLDWTRNRLPINISVHYLYHNYKNTRKR